MLGNSSAPSTFYVPVAHRTASNLNVCHTRRRFHCIATELYNFPEHPENSRNHDIFREKMSVTVSLQRPRRWNGALMVFYRVPKVFMV